MAKEDIDKIYQQQTVLNLYNSGIPTETISLQVDISEEEVEKVIQVGKNKKNCQPYSKKQHPN